MLAALHIRVNGLTSIRLQTQADVSCKRWRAHYNNVNIQLCKWTIPINYTQVWVGWTCMLSQHYKRERAPMHKNGNYHHLTAARSHFSKREIALIASTMPRRRIWGILLVAPAQQIAGRVTTIHGMPICGPESQLQTAQQRAWRKWTEMAGSGYGGPDGLKTLL